MPVLAGTEIDDLRYVITFEELSWGALLILLTMTIHGMGMMFILRANGALSQRLMGRKSLLSGLFVLVSATWMIMLLHLSEVLLWSEFLFWKQAFPNASICFYFTLNEYTTLGSKYNLPYSLRLLEGMIAMSGLLTFAWSTGVLFAFAKSFQDEQMQLLQQRKANRKKTHSPASRNAQP